MDAVELQNIWFSYGSDRSVLRGLNLSIPRGEIFGVLGRNGAGKTTTFRILCGLLRPEQGAVIVDGFDASKAPTDVKRRIAFLPAVPLLYEQLSAEENLNMFAMLWGVDSGVAKKRSNELLDQVGLWHVRRDWVESYSTGMKQRLSIGAAFLLDPLVFVMDEPFNGLDMDGTLWTRELLKELAGRGKTIVFSSHVPEIVESLAQTIAVLDDGRIVAQEAMTRVSQLGGVSKYFDLKARRPCA